MKIKPSDLIFFTVFSALLCGTGYFFKQSFDDVTARMDAAYTECRVQGGTLTDTSSGYICINERKGRTK